MDAQTHILLTQHGAIDILNNNRYDHDKALQFIINRMTERRDTRNHPLFLIMKLMIANGDLNNPGEVREFIEDFE